MFYVILIFDVLVILTHIMALRVLINKKQKRLKGNQKMLLITLSVAELTYAVINIGMVLGSLQKFTNLTDAFFTLNFVSGFWMYWVIMTLITLDRFLEIYLNIKYSILCSFVIQYSNLSASFWLQLHTCISSSKS